MSETRAPDLDDIARLPILIGFTGRRRFADETHENENQRLLGIVAERFRRVAQWLDRELPLTPKVLICGGDAGSDLAVVTEVLSGSPEKPDHPLWSVVLMHAFIGYEPGSDAKAAYEALETKYQGRIVVRSLKPLLKVPVDENDPDQAKTMAEQMPMPDAPKEERDHFRSGHFEQHALWLARYATVQIAASAAGSGVEGVAKPGATARLVAYRRAAIPDDYASSVIKRSQILLAGSPLDEPDGGHVLWIDPTAEDPWPADLPPVQILGPIQDHYDQRKGTYSLDHGRNALYQAPFGETPVGGRPIINGDPRPALESAIEVGRKFEGLHHRALPWHQRLPGITAPALGAASFSGEEPHKFLKRLRVSDAPIGRQQLTAHGIVRWSLRGLIMAFLGAVFFYEGYLELQPQKHWWLFAYVAVLTAMGIAVFVVTQLDAARRTEDLRGLREVLRVQIAWWASGIDRMVDRVHLRSIDSDLKIIREIAATVSMWAILRTSTKIPDDNCDFSEASAWIDEQVKYHRARWVSNDGFKQLSQQGSRIGLGTAWLSLLAMFIIFWRLGADSHIASTPRAWTALALATWTILAMLVAVEFTQQFTGWRSLIRWPHGFREVATVAGTVAVALTLCALPLSANTLRPKTFAFLAILLIGMLALSWFVRMEWRTKAWKVERMSLWHQLLCIVATVGFLLGLATILAPAAAPWIEGPANTVALADQQHAPDEQVAKSKSHTLDSEDVKNAFRALVLTTTTLLLGASGMLRYYVERRNHAAQAAQSDDCHRAFLRAQAKLTVEQKALADSQNKNEPALSEARKLVVEIGELALDENEAWLRAHRERPVEAIS